MSITLINVGAGFGAGAATGASVRPRFDVRLGEGFLLPGFVARDEDDFSFVRVALVLAADFGAAGVLDSFADFEDFGVFRARRGFDGFEVGGFFEGFFAELGRVFFAAFGGDFAAAFLVDLDIPE